MAKATKSERSKAGKKAWKKKVAKARAEGKKSVKVGKHRVAISGALKKGIKKERARRAGQGKALAKATRKSPKRKGHKRAAPKVHHKHHHHTKVVTKRRTVEVKVPGKTRKVFVTAADRHHKRRRGHRRAREGYAMENPLSTMEVLGGGLAMLFGLAVADVTDRYLATNALTASTSGTATTYTNTPVGTAGTAPASTFGVGLYPGMLNGAAVIAPMNTTRLVAGGVLSAVPFLAAAYIKAPVARTGFQMFGFGVIARIWGKFLVDTFAGLLGSTQLGQQLYVNELAATAQYQVATTGTTTIVLPSPGVTPTTSQIGPTGSASGLAKAHQPNMCCAGCASGRPCTREHPPAMPSDNGQGGYPGTPATNQGAGSGGSTSVSTQLDGPGTSQSVNGLPQLTAQGIQQAILTGGATGQTTPIGAGRPFKPNPYNWSQHITGDAPARIH